MSVATQEVDRVGIDHPLVLFLAFSEIAIDAADVALAAFATPLANPVPDDPDAIERQFRCDTENDLVIDLHESRNALAFFSRYIGNVSGLDVDEGDIERLRTLAPRPLPFMNGVPLERCHPRAELIAARHWPAQQLVFWINAAVRCLQAQIDRTDDEVTSVLSAAAYGLAFAGNVMESAITLHDSEGAEELDVIMAAACASDPDGDEVEDDAFDATAALSMPAERSAGQHAPILAIAGG